MQIDHTRSPISSGESGGGLAERPLSRSEAAPRRKYPWGALLHGHLVLAVFCETQQALLANKLDELLRVNKEAQNAMLGLEALDLKQLEALRRHYRALGENQVFDLEGLGDKSKPKQDLNEC